MPAQCALESDANETPATQVDELATPRCGALQTSGKICFDDDDEGTPLMHAADITLDMISDEEIPFVDLSEFDCESNNCASQDR